jgi:hypothetical protein
MIETTYTYIHFWSADDSKKAKIDALEKQLSDFTETQTDVNLETFLSQFLDKKPLLDVIGIENIAIYHTLLYDSQCNTEFSPKVVELIQQIGATFCISTDCIRNEQYLPSVPSGGDGIIEDVIERYSKEINKSIPYTFDESCEVLFADIDATALTYRQIFELGFRYGQQTEYQRSKQERLVE